MTSSSVSAVVQKTDDVRGYRTIVADPPWEYDGFRVSAATGRSNNTRRDGARAVPSKGVYKALPYDAMSVEAISALPVLNLVDPSGSRVFLWTTNRYLPEAFGVLTAWGFAYRQTIVWHKLNPSPFSGSVAFNAAEYLLVGTRGALESRPKATSSVLAISVPKEHSRKPDAFLDLVEQVSPGPYLEMFARRQRLGWDTWGDEALNHVEISA